MPFLDGRLSLREPRRGHRSGTDAILLAAAARLQPGQHLLDVGAGSGAAALAVLAQTTGTRATLLELDPDMARLATFNAATNGFVDRATVVVSNLFDRKACRAAGLEQADVVISNPPFYLEGTVRASRNAQQARSHVLSGGDHAGWFRACLALVKPGGHVAVIHRPDALAALLAGAEMRAAVHLQAIHSRSHEAAKRILLTATRGSKAPLVIDAPLVLHTEDGVFTARAEDIHRGRNWP